MCLSRTAYSGHHVYHRVFPQETMGSHKKAAVDLQMKSTADRGVGVLAVGVKNFAEYWFLRNSFVGQYQ